MLPIVIVIIAVQYFDALLVQVRGIRFVPVKVVPDECYLKAHLDKELQIHIRAFAARVLVVMGHIMVNHQNLLPAAAAVLGQKYILTVREVFGLQHILPFVIEFLLVHSLVFLLSRSQVGAIGDSLKMHHYGQGLIDYFISMPAHFKGQVGILIISRRKTFIETADLFPQAAADHDSRAGDVICLLDIVVLRVFRVLQMAIVPGGGVFPEDASCLLQAAVGIDQFGTGHPYGCICFQQFHQRQEPVFLHLGIVVQEQDILSLYLPGCVVAAMQETKVLTVADTADAGYDFLYLRSQVSGAVVCQEDFVCRISAVL
ncbi:hypothetical protein IMSAGC003_01225 [Lachnospiraceae bacterium]|nr:hypothetical protein IMSAGC003_01225 [Lachnospiraceae bacterium]